MPCEGTRPVAGHKPPPGARRNREGEAGCRRSARPSPQGEQSADPTEAIAGTAAELDEAAWFSRPWRDGYLAVKLLETLGLLHGGAPLPPALHSTLARPADETDAADYATVAAVALESTLLPGVDGVVVPAAAACLANWIAQSHGGGVVPNVHLRSTVGWLLWHGLDPVLARWEIGRARSLDLQLDAGRAAAFMRLWRRRQYGAAWRLAA